VSRPLHIFRRFLKDGSSPWFHSDPEALGALANLYLVLFQGFAILRPRIGKDASDFGKVFAIHHGDQLSAIPHLSRSDEPLRGTSGPS